jgi:1,2-diacylglycerol 3-beta-galactosyltransferase
VQCGLPIRKGFWAKGETKSRQTPKNNLMQMFGGKIKPVKVESKKIFLRQELDLDESLPTVLMVGGGDGMGGIKQIAKALGEKLGQSSDSPAYQMVVVCGNNKQAQESLSSQNWGSGVKVRILGFVNNMDEWMNASDALVTKAGPGTIAEASICGLPCMLFAYL